MRVVRKHNVWHLTNGLDLDIKIKRVDIRFFKIDGTVWFYLVLFEGFDPVNRPVTVPGKIAQDDVRIPIGTSERGTRLRKLSGVFILRGGRRER